MNRLAALLLLAPLAAPAATTTEVVASGFDRPVFVDTPRHISDRLWVVEQAGKIWIIDRRSGERLSKKPFLDITKNVSREGNEEGLLGLAFDPEFEKNGRFYLNYTDKKHVTRIERYTAKGPDFSTADRDSAELLLSFDQPYKNHNGGWIGFGPDGLLYIGTGDGGAANDPQQHGQDLSSLLGKMLRIDVRGDSSYKIPADNPFPDGKKGRPEIWAFGLRNPWRNSFDRDTGDLWIGDVGQNKWEEINFVPAGKGSGANFGWRMREGTNETPTVGGEAPDKNYIPPVYVYDHGAGPKEGLSVTGGYVYRGPVKELQGRYVFGDYQNQRVWSFVLDGVKATDFQDHTDAWKADSHSLGLLASFGEDNDGHLYLTTFTGEVRRVVER